MPTIPIDSIDDPRILPYRDLPRGGRPKQLGSFVVEGAWLVERLLASNYEVQSLFVDRSRSDQFATKVSAEVPVYVAERPLLKAIIGFDFHRCVLACGRRPSNPSLDDLLSLETQESLVVVCDAVSDPENLGGVLRNCAAFGIDAVLLGPTCTDPYSRRVLRVSMGAVFRLAVAQSEDLVTDLLQLRGDYGFDVVATVLDVGAPPLESSERAKRTALLFGNEARGLDERLIAACDQCVTVPMQPGTDSLNVAVSSGIFLYHYSKNRPYAYESDDFT